MEMKSILTGLAEGQVFTKEESREILTKLAQGEYNLSQMSAFLMAFLMREITAEELSGFRAAMLDLCRAMDLSEFDAMDMCGTGGDGKDTFNISTTSSFVVAGAGQKVTKHGNNGVSSSCGSSNLLAHFGYEFKSEEDDLRKSLDGSGICFIHAPLFHPAMKNVAPVRKELGLKTFFNMLGPLVNPSRPKKQLVGTYNLKVAELYQQILSEERIHCAIVHALDGYDEISLTGDFQVYTANTSKVYSPTEVGLSFAEADDIFGGATIEESADIFMKVLKGTATEAQINVVLANAGLALYVGQELDSFEEGISKAKESIDSGSALKCFDQFIEINRS